MSAVTQRTAQPTLAAAVARALARHASHVFGLMGNGNAHLIDALATCNVPFTAVRHEAGTVAAADAYARVSGRLAVATTTYGAGFTNTLTALAEAAQARTPMLLVVGDAPTTGPRPWDVDQEMLAAAMGVRTHTLTLEDPEGAVDRAAASALGARKPVVLAIPYDLATAPTAPTAPPHGARPEAADGIDLDDPEVVRSLLAATRPQAEAQTLGVATPGVTTPGNTGGGHPGTPPPGGAQAPAVPTPAAGRIAEAARLLAGAARPVVIAGRGAHLSGAAAELGAIAAQLGALTATTALARGIFPEPAYDLGITGGFGQEAAMARIAEADVALVVGAGLNQFTMRFGELFGAGTAVVRVDLDEAPAPKTAHPIRHLLLRGDARRTLLALSEALAELGSAPSRWREATAGLEPGGALRVRDRGTTDPDGLIREPGGERLDPRAVAARLAELLPEDRHVTSDGGHFIGWANMFWPVASPERMIMVGTAYQTIGLGFSTVAGVAAAAPGSTVVLSTGDGGGLMALADLETAIRTAPSCVVVVWNDGAYGAEVHLYGLMGLDERPMRIPDVDFAGVASALGATGVRVERLNDLDALAEWRAAGCAGTILLDCRISRSVVAPYQREIQRVNGLDPE